LSFLEIAQCKVMPQIFLNNGDIILGYRAVHVNWKDLDYCNVCDMDEVVILFLFLTSYAVF
jgi:hypothetical protein